MNRHLILIAVLLAGIGPAFGQNAPGRVAPVRPRPRPVVVTPAFLPPAVEKALASSRLPYSGVRTLEFVGKKGRQTHVEFVIHDGDRTRIEFPQGTPFAGQVVVEDAKQRQQYFPKRNEIEILPPRNDVTMVRLENAFRKAARSGWVIGTLPGEDIAGYATVQAYVNDPRGNVRQRLWIDPNTGMILRRVIFAPGGALQAGFEFTQLRYNPSIPGGTFVLNKPGARIVTPQMKAQALAAKNGFKPLQAPQSGGFRLESARIATIGGETALVEVYAGPAGRISVFHLRSQLDPSRLQEVAQGRYRVYTWQRNGETLALVGDIDDRRLQEVVRQLGG